MHIDNCAKNTEIQVYPKRVGLIASIANDLTMSTESSIVIGMCIWFLSTVQLDLELINQIIICCYL